MFSFWWFAPVMRLARRIVFEIRWAWC